MLLGEVYSDCKSMASVVSRDEERAIFVVSYEMRRYCAVKKF